MKNKDKKKRKLPPFIKFILFIVNVLTIAFLITTYYLNIVPLKYYIIIVIVVLLFDYISCTLLIKKNKKKRLIGLFLSILLSIGFGIGIYYETKTNTFFDTITSKSKVSVNYVVVVRNDSSYNDIKDIDGKSLGILNLNESPYINAKDKINKEVSTNNKSFEDTYSLSDALVMKDIDASLIEESYHKIFQENYEIYANNTKVLYQFSIDFEEQEIKKDTDITKNSFNLFISGIDTYGNINVNSRSDVNMVVTINPKTHKISLVDIPRDYYVNIDGREGKKDKLTHAGISGVDTSVKTVEKLLGVDINYYVKFNFTSLVKIVDKIGPIRVYSDESFVSGIYDPGVKKEYRYYKGWNTLNGDEALSFARERHAFEDGDRVRGKHQQILIEAILNKITSPAIIVNYTSLLDALSKTFITNLEDENLKKIIKMQIDENIDWEVQKYVLNGESGLEYTYSYPKQKLYVMIPNEDSINEAKSLISNTYNG